MLFGEVLQYLLIGVVATGTVWFGSWVSSLGNTDGNVSEQRGGGPHHNHHHEEELTMGQALTFPIYASVSLLIMFFFFNYIQYFLVFFLLFGSSVALYQVIDVLYQTYLEPRVSMRIMHLMFPYVNGVITALIALEWIRSGNVMCHDILGCALCVMFIATLKFPSLKVAALLLSLLFLYDMFWVFFSEYFFSDNVMVAVATKQASNPINDAAQFMHIGKIVNAATHVELPIKLIFPNPWTGRMMMLGLGDIALPGALVSLALRSDMTVERNAILDNEKKEDVESLLSEGRSVGRNYVKPCLFATAIAGYFCSLVLAFVANVTTGHPQPALIYIVPGVLGPLSWRAYQLGKLSDIWNGRFNLEYSR